MKLDFKILWVDDHPTAIEEDLKALEIELRNFGFNPIFSLLNGFDKVSNLMNDNPGDDEFDLILVDFDLGKSGGNGGNAAREIRNKFPHREMVFYSGKSPNELHKAALENDIQGVFFAHRPTLADEVFEVIEHMLRKIIDVSHMRGIVMAETSDLDHHIEQSLKTAFDMLKADRQKNFHNKAVEVIQKRAKDQLEKVGKHLQPEMFSDLLTTSRLMTSQDKTRSLMRYLETESNLPNKKKHVAAVHDYQTNFQNVRNDLAHGIVLTTEDGRKVFQGQDIELDEEKMRKWRVSLVKHRDQIKSVAADLGVIFKDE